MGLAKLGSDSTNLQEVDADDSSLTPPPSPDWSATDQNNHTLPHRDA